MLAQADQPALVHPAAQEQRDGPVHREGREQRPRERRPADREQQERRDEGGDARDDHRVRVGDEGQERGPPGVGVAEPPRGQRRIGREIGEPPGGAQRDPGRRGERELRRQQHPEPEPLLPGPVQVPARGERGARAEPGDGRGRRRVECAAREAHRDREHEDPPARDERRLRAPEAAGVHDPGALRVGEGAEHAGRVVRVAPADHPQAAPRGRARDLVLHLVGQPVGQQGRARRDRLPAQVPADVGRERARVPVPARGVGLHRRQADLLQVRGRVRGEFLRQADRPAPEDVREHRGRGAAREGTRPGQQFIKQHPEREDIRLGPDRGRREQLLGGRVPGRAAEGGPRAVRLGAGEAEIDDRRVRVPPDEDVRGLEVPVGQAPLVHRRDGVDDAEHQRDPGLRGLPAREPVDRLALRPPHHQERGRRVQADLDDRAQRRVIEARHRARLGPQTLQHPPGRARLGVLRGVRPREGQQLDRDRRPARDRAGAEHAPRPAPPRQRLDPVPVAHRVRGEPDQLLSRRVRAGRGRGRGAGVRSLRVWGCAG
jgi:hypothetical protein